MLRHPLVVVVWIAVIGLAADTLGRPVLERLLSEEAEDRALEAFQAQLLGLAILGELAFLLTAVGSLDGELLVLLVVAVAVAGLWRRRRQLSVPRFDFRNLLGTAGLCLVGLFFLSFLPEALSPVLHHDDNVYHLDLPQRYLEAGGLVTDPFDVYANMPHFAEILYTIPMAIGDFTAPKVLVFFVSGFSLVALVAVAGRRAGIVVGALVGLLYLSGKNVQWHLGLAYVEPVIGAYLLGSALAVTAWRRGVGRGALWLVGIHLGIAMSCKYTAWVFAAVLGASALALSGRGGDENDRLRRLVRVAVPPALLVFPWLVKNGVVTGNPLFPNLSGIFGTGAWDAIQIRQFRRMVLAPGGGPGRDWTDLLMVPWNLAVRDDFYRAPSTSITLLLLVFAALALFLIPRIEWVGDRLRRGGWCRSGPPGRSSGTPTPRDPGNASREGDEADLARHTTPFVRLRPPRAPAAWVPPVAVLGLAVWAIFLARGRFLVAWVPILVLAAVEALRPLRGRRGALAAAGLAILSLGAWQLVAQRYPWNPTWEALTAGRTALLSENHNWVLTGRLESLVPPEGKILSMWDNRFFFLDREVLSDSAYEAPTGLARLRAADDPERFARELEREGITHVVIDGAQMRRYVEDRYEWSLLDSDVYSPRRFARDRQLLASFIAGELELVEASGRHGIFRLATSAERPGDR